MPDFDFRDPKNQRLIAAFLIPVVGLLAFYNFVVQPKMNELDLKRAEYNTQQAQLVQIQNTLKPREQLENRKQALLDERSEIERLLPAEENVALLLDQFSKVEKDARVYLVGFHASGGASAGGLNYTSNRYEVTVEAGYHQFAQFMTGLLSLPRIMSVSDLRIMQNPMSNQNREASWEGLEDQPRYLTVECVLTTYIYQPQIGDDES